MKNAFSFFVIFLFLNLGFKLKGQNIGIGTNAPDASAKLEIQSTVSGLLISRMTNAQMNAISVPATGLMVYNTTLTQFMYFNGSDWKRIHQNYFEDDDGDTKIHVEESVDEDFIRFDAIGNEAMIIDTNGNVGIDTSSPHATAKLHINPGINLSAGILVSGTYNNSSTIPDLGAGSRMMFYPGKASFRAGRVSSTQWDNANTGLYSVAYGNNTIASGEGSIAIGDSTIASGDYSTALGTHTIAQAYSSFVIGRYNIGGGSKTTWVSTDPTFEVGIGTATVKKNAFTILKNGHVGIGTIPHSSAFFHVHMEDSTEGVLFTGDYFSGTTIPNVNIQTSLLFYPGKSAFWMGTENGWMQNSDFGEFSIAMGYHPRAARIYSIAIGGYQPGANAQRSVAIGFRAMTNVNVFGESVAIHGTTYGAGTAIMGNASTGVAIGYGSSASGGVSFRGQAISYGSQSLGIETEALGVYSTTTGYSTIAKAYNSMAIGRWNIGSGDSLNWISTDPIFEIGIGYSAMATANAFTILKNGNTGIGTVNPSVTLDVEGTFQYVDGNETTDYMLRCDAGGNATWVDPNTLITNDADWTINGNIQYSAVSGNVGIGTTTPTYKLDVNGDVAGSRFFDRNNTAYYLNPAGLSLLFSLRLVNGAVNGHILRTDASGNATWVNPTSISDGDWTISGNNQYSAVSGNVGIGTTVPTQKLQVVGNVYASGGDFYAAGVNGVFNAGGGIMSANINTISDNVPTYNNVGGDEDLLIQGDLEVQTGAYKPGGGAWSVMSDERLKKNIAPFTDGLSKLMQINPVWFQYTAELGLPEPEKRYVGVIAQKIRQVLPFTIEETMIGQMNGEDEQGNEYIIKEGKPYLTFDPSALTYVTINAVQEQQVMIDERQELINTLVDENESQKQQIKLLIQKLEQLEQLINAKGD
jgi:Chaperone of endosialidase/YadA head domain repeat (2 copies)